MDSCEHVKNLKPFKNDSILCPQRWICSVCGTTESVYACLSCGHVACGRFNEEHSLQHFKDSKHPIAIEVNKKHVYCYACDDYVLNDNDTEDVHQLRTALRAIAKQSFQDVSPSDQPLLRSFSVHEEWSEVNLDQDKLLTAESYHKAHLLRKCFKQWCKWVAWKVNDGSSQSKKRKLVESTSTWRPAIIPGVTGLRNLGNTCYMNSILQVLSHTKRFRNYFRRLLPKSDFSPWGSPYSRTPSTPNSGKEFMRQNTQELYQYLSESNTSPGRNLRESVRLGLSGGASPSTPSQHNQPDNLTLSLCVELHVLLRVLWSGKWVQVSPHVFLQAVWKLLPTFKGYSQHDAQEFLCELLDEVREELRTPNKDSDIISTKLSSCSTDIITSIFQGQLISQVTCDKCGNKSQTFESFLDLSLEFPDRYHNHNWLTENTPCHITEMLAKFTEVENLECNSYACDECNRIQQSFIRTNAKKQLLVHKLPDVLRLHLKRFRWSGRNHREKICSHVEFDDRLDMQPYCAGHVSGHYRLTGVVIHHGKEFHCGHYTAYNWNEIADSWVYCNDARVELSSLQKVQEGQAYILFYTRDELDDLPLAKPLQTPSETGSDEEVNFNPKSVNLLLESVR